MKRFLVFLAIAAMSLMSIESNAETEDGHVLTSLWKSYSEAEAKDRPQDEAKILSQIKSEAAARKLAWDWCDAAKRYVDVKTSINWKDRSSLTESLDSEVEALGIPVVYLTHFAGSKADWAWLEANKTALQGTYNKIFAQKYLSFGKYTTVLTDLLSNDYEYGVWLLEMRSKDDKKTLENTFRTYPLSALVDYHGISWGKNRRAELEAFVKKYDGKAAALLASEDLLRMDFEDLQGKNSTSAQYLALKKKCEAFEKQKSAFKGSEKAIAECCDDVKEILEEMSSKNVCVSVKDNVATVEFRNVKSATLKINKTDEKETLVKSIDVKNPVCGYYAYDTLKVNLPLIDDGEYEVECAYGGETAQCDWSKYSVSIAARSDSEGVSVFAADYQSGRPLGKCQLILEIEDKEVAHAEIDCSDGFCRIPQSMLSKMKSSDWKNAFHVEAKSESGLLLLSKDVNSVQKVSSTDKNEGADRQHCTVLTDRRAYNPGESVNFKVIAYLGTYEYRLVPEDTKYTVILFNSKQETVETKTFRTNGFGSFAGSFELKDDSHGGSYEIEVKKGSELVGWNYFTVDSFELPSFELVHEDDSRLYLPGETVVFKGVLKSYSGHPLTSAKATYTVPFIEDGSEQSFDISSDGSFSFEFKIPSKDTGLSCRVHIKVVDGTGETREFDYRLNSGKFSDFYVHADNETGGKVSGKVNDGSNNVGILKDDDVKIKYSAKYHPSFGLSYKLLQGGKTIREGVVVKPGEAESSEGFFHIDMSGLPNKVYKLVVTGTMTSETGENYTCEEKRTYVRVPDELDTFPIKNTVVFKRLDVEDGIGLQLVSTVGETWAVAELFGNGNQLLEHQIVRIEGSPSDCSKSFVFHREPEWPDLMTLRVLFFHGGKFYEYNFDKEVPAEKDVLPLSFTRFFDTTAPRGAYSILASTRPGVECAATIFDLTTESIQSNWWRAPSPGRLYYAHSKVNSECGCNDGEGRVIGMFECVGAAPRMMKLGRSTMDSGIMLMNQASADGVVEEETEEVVEEEAIPFMLPDRDFQVRENFAKTVAWEPFLRSDENGGIELKFTNADKLSTFVVQLFAHDRNMNCATIRRNMVVTVPVKLSIAQPQVLREGDKYVARVSLTNGLAEVSKGVVTLRLFNGSDWKTATEIAAKAYKTTVPASQSVTVDCPIEIPETGLETLGILATYVPDDAENCSDAMFVTVPVIAGEQTITEAHSAVLRSGDDKTELEKKLRAMFVNVPGSEAEMREISIRAMLSEAVPEKIDTDSEDAIGAAESLYADYLAAKLGSDAMTNADRIILASKITNSRNSDGGYGWFQGMQSSMTVTAFLLQRNRAMGGALLHNDAEAAVRFLDSQYLSQESRPIWCGGMSLGQYLYVRSMYCDVPFETMGVKAETLKKFREQAKDYLVPSKARGLNGEIFAKARRLLTLKNMIAGGDFAESLAGISAKKLAKSLGDDAESLLQYAVRHDCGGWYYPNLVMPFRGLLESEASAHAMLCNLLDGLDDARAAEISEGVRFWIMLQKETQQWSSDPGYLEALDAVFHGSEATLETKVLALSATTTLPFEQVKASGNGFTIERKWFIGDREIHEGDTLKVGNRVRAEYRIWNKENRSFVKLTAPRPASMRPVDQLSGHYGWWLSPLRVAGWYSFSPQGYRTVRPGKTEYWFDSYPEENTTVGEEFYVSQEGEFRCPVVTIESLYAPHYRANDRGASPIKSLYL